MVDKHREHFDNVSIETLLECGEFIDTETGIKSSEIPDGFCIRYIRKIQEKLVGFVTKTSKFSDEEMEE
jgi:hypothetical protein